MKTDNAIIGLTIAALAGTTLLSLMEASEEMMFSTPKRNSNNNPIKDRTLFNHGKYVTTWYQSEVKEFDENYIKYNADPYQIYTNSNLCKHNGKSLEEIMARVGIYNKRNTIIKNNSSAEGVQI